MTKRFELTVGETFTIGNKEMRVAKCGMRSQGGCPAVPTVTLEEVAKAPAPKRKKAAKK